MTSPDGDLPPESDATANDHLAENTDNGPDPDVDAPSQDPNWDPNDGVDIG